MRHFLLCLTGSTDEYLEESSFNYGSPEDQGDPWTDTKALQDALDSEVKLEYALDKVKDDDAAEEEDESLVSETHSEKNSNNGNMFLEAAEKGDVGVMRTVMAAGGFDADKKTRYQDRGALHLACGYGQLDAVKHLLEVTESDPWGDNFWIILVLVQLQTHL